MSDDTTGHVRARPLGKRGRYIAAYPSGKRLRLTGRLMLGDFEDHGYAPKKAVGLDGALGSLAHQTYGQFLLGVVAAGLIAFGVYSIADARYRRI